VLQWLARISERCLDRCLDYLDAQMVLCEAAAQKCMAREQSTLEASLARLRGFARANNVLRNVLLRSRQEHEPNAMTSEIEEWLEAGPPEVSACLGGDRTE
jgi:hypothetical protein